MAFMPAEEDDDFYQEDGFIDCEAFTEPPLQERSFKQQMVAEKADLTNERGDGMVRRKQTSGIFSRSFQKSSTPKKSSSVITTEDLRMGIMKNNREIVEKYYNLGLPIDEPLRSGWTALMYAAHYVRPEYVSLLLQFGASVNYHCDMFTPLMCACSATSGDVEGVFKCVKVLLEAGAAVNAKDRFHKTPLMFASREGYLSVVKALVSAGAQVNMQDNQGWTALTMATQRSRAAVIVELLDSGADVNIQHSDKLTVKDLAAHLPTDDMLALLERRPVNSVNQPLHLKLMTSNSNATTSDYSMLDAGDSQARLTDLRYGELEVFLLGLDLGHLVGLFQEQLIDLRLLMTLTEQDLINAGVNQVGARKKILDAVQAVHKKGWQPSSLVSIHFNRRISCADAVAMLANSSRHLHYICSTVVYVKEQLRKHPETIMQPTDRVTPNQFLRHTEDTKKNLLALESQVETLRTELEKRMLGHNVDPPDLIREEKYDAESKGPSLNKSYRTHRTIALMAATCLAVAATAWWSKDRFMHLVLVKDVAQ